MFAGLLPPLVALTGLFAEPFGGDAIDFLLPTWRLGH